MAIDAADWTVDRVTGNIRYIGGDHASSPTYATVIEFYRWLQGLADDELATGDDELDITNPNPGIRSTDNIITLLGLYNIDDGAAEHLYDGSIIQGTGGTEEIYDGIVNFGTSTVQIQIIQDGAVLTDDWWNFGGGGLNADAANGISHRFMIKTRTAGADIDGRRLIGTSRTFGDTYSEFSINGTSRGNNVLALSTAEDLNNATAIGTIAGYTNITNTTEGYVGIDVDQIGGAEFYYSQWDRDTQSINDLYERMKWLTRDGSASTLYGLNGELFRGITHEVAVNTPTGTFNAFEPVSWTGGTGQMLAIDSPTAATTMWLQLLTGVAPSGTLTITGGTSSATVATNTTVTDRSALIKTPFNGASTGTAIIGSYGFGVERLDLTKDDKVFDLTNTQKIPPNLVTFTISGLVIGDRVLIAPWDGVATDTEGFPEPDFNQLLLNTTLTSAAETAVVATTPIPSDTPEVGTIRIEADDGRLLYIEYLSWTGSTFTIASTAFNGADPAPTTCSAFNNVMITYVDIATAGTQESFQGVYNADRDLVALVRDGGGTPIKQFISSAVLGSTGGSLTAIRTSDT